MVVKWQNTGEAPVVQEGRKCAGDTPSLVAHHYRHLGKTRVRTVQVGGQAWGQLRTKTVNGTGVMCGTYSWDSDNTLPCSSTETCSAMHSPFTERLLEIQGESREARRPAWGSGRSKS